jgi:hypothetical protein
VSGCGQRFRDGIEAHAHAGAGGVEQVNGLVRQLTARQITARKRDGSSHRIIGNVHVVVLSIAGFQTTQHQAGRVIIRLVHLHHLEATLQGGIALEVLLVFGPGGRGDGAQFASRQRRFQQVGGICAPA